MHAVACNLASQQWQRISVPQYTGQVSHRGAILGMTITELLRDFTHFFQLVEELTLNKVVGLDFGGVIVRHQSATLGEDTALPGGGGLELANAGVFEAVSRIVDAFSGKVWIISKAGIHMQERSLKWLDEVNFYNRTKFPPDHIRFCLTREAKKEICEELQVSYFVDDRIHVMQILRNTVDRLILFGNEERRRHCPPWARYATSWSEIEIELFAK